MPRVLTEAEKRRRAGFQQNFTNTTGVAVNNNTTAQGGRTNRATTTQTAQRNSNRAVQGQTQQQQQAANQQQRNPRFAGHPANARFVSRDGRVSYNAQGQRLDSNGNVALQTRRGRRGSSSAGDGAAAERTTGLRTDGTGVEADEGAAAAALQLPWLAFLQSQAAAGGAGTAAATNANAGGFNAANLVRPGAVNLAGGQAAAQNVAAQQQAQQAAIAQTGFVPQAVNAGQFANLGIPAPTANPQIWQGLSPQQQQAALNYYNTVLPFAQLNQNAFQYQNDFSEAQRRFQLELAQRQQEAGFNAAGRAQLPNRRFI